MHQLLYSFVFTIFTIFYDFSSNIQTSLRNMSLECIIFMNFYRVIPFTIVYTFYDFLQFLIQHPNWYQKKHKTTFKKVSLEYIY